MRRTDAHIRGITAPGRVHSFDTAVDAGQAWLEKANAASHMLAGPDQTTRRTKFDETF